MTVDRSRLACTLAVCAVALLAYLSFDLERERIIFNIDIGEQVDRSLEVLQGGPYPLLGTAVATGDGRLQRSIWTGPACFYALAPALALGGIEGMVHFTAWLAALGAGLWVWLGWRWISPLAGVLAGIFHGLHPLMVEWVVHPYHVGLVPFFTAVAFVACAWALEAPGGRSECGRALVAGVAVGLATHGHAVALGFLPMLPLVRWAVQRRFSPWPVLAYGLGVAVTYGSWILFELRNDFWQLGVLAELIFGEGGSAAEARAGVGLTEMLRELTRPTLIFRLGLVLGLLSIPLRLRREQGPAGDRLRTGLALCAFGALGWVAFMAAVCVPSASFGNSSLWGRFFLPMLGPVSLVAGAGWASAIDLLRSGARELAVGRVMGRVVAAALVGLAVLVGIGAVQDRYRPYWDGDSHAVRLPHVERFVAWLRAESQGGAIANLSQISHPNGPVPGDATMVLSALPLLEWQKVQEGGVADPPRPRLYSMVAARDCAGGTEERDHFERHIDLLHFDDCPSLQRWHRDYLRSCEEAGHVASVITATYDPWRCGEIIR